MESVSCDYFLNRSRYSCPLFVFDYIIAFYCKQSPVKHTKASSCSPPAIQQYITDGVILLLFALVRFNESVFKRISHGFIYLGHSSLFFCVWCSSHVQLPCFHCFLVESFVLTWTIHWIIVFFQFSLFLQLTHYNKAKKVYFKKYIFPDDEYANIFLSWKYFLFCKYKTREFCSKISLGK